MTSGRSKHRSSRSIRRCPAPGPRSGSGRTKAQRAGAAQPGEVGHLISGVRCTRANAAGSSAPRCRPPTGWWGDGDRACGGAGRAALGCCLRPQACEMYLFSILIFALNKLITLGDAAAHTVRAGQDCAALPCACACRARGRRRRDPKPT